VRVQSTRHDVWRSGVECGGIDDAEGRLKSSTWQRLASFRLR
jgi:hypothetical protein